MKTFDFYLFHVMQHQHLQALISWTLTSDLLLQAKYDSHSLMEDE